MNLNHQEKWRYKMTTLTESKREDKIMNDESLELSGVSVDESLLENREIAKQWRIDLQKFLILLDKDPSAIKKHPKQGFEYVPIGSLEAGLDKLFFGLWSWQITFPQTTIRNEIISYGRLTFFHPVAKVWLHRDGVGASQVRFKQNSDFTDIKNKIQTALQMDSPHADAKAFKNACQKIGKIFGRGLRRDYTEDYEELIPSGKPDKKKKNADSKLLEQFKTEVDQYPHWEPLQGSAYGIVEKAKKAGMDEMDQALLKNHINTVITKMKGKK